MAASETTVRCLRLLRRKVADVDPAAQRRTDPELLEALADAAYALAARGHRAFDAVAVQADINAPGYGLTPALAADDVAILVTRCAADLLVAQYHERLDRGELGISWRSGLEEESTISAERAYRDRIGMLEAELDQLLLIQGAPTAATRPQ